MQHDQWTGLPVGVLDERQHLTLGVEHAHRSGHPGRRQRPPVADVRRVLGRRRRGG